MRYSFYVLTIKILCIGVVLASEVKAQYSIRDVQVSLDQQTYSVPDILYEIQSKTDFRFSYNKEDLDKKSIELASRAATVAEILQDVSNQAYLGFRQLGYNISVTKQPRNKVSERIVVDVPISGTVTDENGLTLPGVNVIVKGTTTGTITDSNGEYRLNVPENAVLVFSHIGFLTREIAISNESVIDISLSADISNLSEVVVTGYQTLSEERVAGSYTKIDQDYIEEHPNLNISTVIDAAMAGVRTEVDVDGNVDFIIRGVSTLNANSQPLIVVDGFPIEGGIETIVPNNVKTIDVLKDAAAASIWGARSTNGVIVITTKDGSKNQKGDIAVNFNSFFTVANKVDMDYAYRVADPQSQLGWEEYLYDIGLTNYAGALEFSDIGIAASLGNTLIAQRQKGLISEEEYSAARSRLLQNNYQSEAEDYLLNSPAYQHYDMSISGRTEKNSYMLTAQYEGGKGRFMGQEDREIQLGFKSTFNITDWLKFYIDATVRKDNNESSGLTMDEITDFPSYSRLLNDDGSYFNQVAPIFFSLSPTVSYKFLPAQEAFLDDAGFDYDWNYNLLREARGRDFSNESNYNRIQAGFNVKIIEGLTWDFKGQYERKLGENRLLYSDDTYFVRGRYNSLTPYDENTNEVTGVSSYPKGDVLQKTYNDLQGYVIRNQVSFNKVISKHAINALAGFEISSTVTNNHSPSIVYGYDDEKLTSIYPTNGYDGLDNFLYSARESYTSITNGQSFYYADKRLFSAFLNGSYTYDEKYTLQASVRTDASNIIVDDPEYRYAPFWSVGGAWNLTNENFMSGADWVNRLRLRLTYGETGNIVNTASIRPTISNVPASFSIDYQPYSSIIDYGNPSLRWERTGTINIGVDYALFSNKIFGSFEFYNKRGRDIIGRVDLPVATGVSSQQFNLAEVRNYGFDFDLKFNTSITPKIKWRNELNISYNNNEVLSLTKGSYASSTLVQPHFEEGKPSNAIYSYNYLGMIDGSPQVEGPEGTTFLLHYPPDISDAHEYMRYSGSTTPTWYGGWLTGFTVDRFTLLFKLKAEFGHVFRTPTFQYRGSGRNVLHEDASSVLAESDTDRIPGLPLENEENIYLWNNFVPYFNTLVDKASYIRLQEVFISYDLNDMINRSGMTELKVYAQARNLGMLWKANDQDLDPVYLTEKPLTYYTIGVRLGL